MTQNRSLRGGLRENRKRWNNIYPSVYALQNGASLDYGEGRAKVFDAQCPDEGRVCIHGEVIDQQIPV